MKNSTLTLLLLLLFFSGCRKIIETVHEINGNETCCQIKSIKFRLDTPFVSATGPFTVRFSYNALGNPVSAIFDPFEENTIGRSFPNYSLYFAYDTLNRLYLIGYKHYHNWMDLVHKLTYVGDSVIVDSTFKDVVGWPHNYKGQRFGTVRHSLDKQGRIIQTYYDIDWQYQIYLPYPYDASGNRILPGNKPTLYDNKINLRRTNKVWQYMDRDYSVNNALETITGGYNAYGLPNKILPKPLTGYFLNWDTQFFADMVFTGAEEVTYDCGKDVIITNVKQ